MNKSFIAIFLSFAALLFVGQSCENNPTPSPDLTQPEIATISSFEECVAAGNPVMESYPRQCRTDKVILFPEIIEEGTLEEVILDPTEGGVDGVVHTGPEDTIEQPIEEPVVSQPADTTPQSLPEPQDSPAVKVDTSIPDEEFDYSEYDSEGRHISDPDYDASSSFDIDVYNNSDYDSFDSVDSNEPQDSMEVDIDGINWGDPVEDTTYEDTSYEDTSVDPNACSPEGAIDNSNGETYHCLDGIWTHELYIY